MVRAGGIGMAQDDAQKISMQQCHQIWMHVVDGQNTTYFSKWAEDSSPSNIGHLISILAYTS
jgi:hypothetical protein